MNTKNLKVLADWLHENKEDIKAKNAFDMGVFEQDKTGDVSGFGCGTVCCVLGWAAHIPELSKNCSNHHQISQKNLDLDIATDLWMFLFSAYWRYIDNTIEGAIARIDYIVAGNPVPEDTFDVCAYQKYIRP